MHQHGHAVRLSILGNGFVGENLLQNFVSAISCYILKETFRVYASLRQSRHRSQPNLSPRWRQLFPTIEMHILCSLEINKEIIAIGVINRLWRTQDSQIWADRFRETFRAIYPRKAGAEWIGAPFETETQVIPSDDMPFNVNPGRPHSLRAQKLFSMKPLAF